LEARPQDRTAGRLRTLTLASVALATLIGALARLAHVSSVDFPLNDGGLFCTMTQDLLASRLAWPLYTSYNGMRLPFVYPPLPFYLAALASLLANAPPVDVLRLLPALFSILTIPAVYLLSWGVLRSRAQSLYATIAYALLPRSFLWLIMGGGLTRAPGLLFAILTLCCALEMYAGRRRSVVPWVILFGGLTVLCHPEAAWFASFSAVLLWLLYGRDRETLKLSLAAGVGVLLVTTPWWVVVITRHGLATLIAAFATGGQNWLAWFPLLTLSFAEETFVDLMTTIGLLGAFLSFARRKWFLPLWVALIVLLDPRSAGTYAVIPLAMLAGLALDAMLLPAIDRAAAAAASAKLPAALASQPESDRPPVRAPALVSRIMLAVLVFYALFSALSVRLLRYRILDVLSADDRQAMTWVREHTPPDARFLVITDPIVWSTDCVSEWFPTLTERVSVATVQGYEWVPDSGFRKQLIRYGGLQECATSDARCVEDWARLHAAQDAYVYVRVRQVKADSGVTRPVLMAVRESLAASQSYRLVYDGPGATVFESLLGVY